MDIDLSILWGGGGDEITSREVTRLCIFFFFVEGKKNLIDFRKYCIYFGDLLFNKFQIKSVFLHSCTLSSESN